MSTPATEIVHLLAEEALEPLVDVDGAIVQAAYLDAVAEVATGRRSDLKAYVAGKLARPGNRVELDGIGVALLTSPTKRAEVVDDDAFRAWALAERPDRTGTVHRVSATAIERALEAGTLEDQRNPTLRHRLAALLDEIDGALTIDVVVDAKLAEDERKAGTEVALEDGTVSIVTEDGERIPGVIVRKASTPAPQIKPDKDLVARLAGEISGRLAPIPTIEESDR